VNQDRLMVENNSSYPDNPDEYEVFELIGEGAFAQVFRGRVRKTKEKVAIKLLDMDKVDSSFNELGAEVFVMRRLDHPNLAKVYSAFTVGSVLWIVQPLEIASCYSIIKKSNLFPRGIKDETLLATILSKVLKGLAYFHEQGMVHRDIKAGNILLSNCGEVKLCDFGVSGTLFENGIQKKKADYYWYSSLDGSRDISRNRARYKGRYLVICYYCHGVSFWETTIRK